ncbi:hypothetical protein J6590_080738 [Homalodisca vitripennis]|nr:hypothetical protein J6590_080738 [Homalodisca vitripennis]
MTLERQPFGLQVQEVSWLLKGMHWKGIHLGEVCGLHFAETMISGGLLLAHHPLEVLSEVVETNENEVLEGAGTSRDLVEATMALLWRVCDASMSKKSLPRGATYWWACRDGKFAGMLNLAEVE